MTSIALGLGIWFGFILCAMTVIAMMVLSEWAKSSREKRERGQ
jgi:hypothetical protein